MKHFESSTINFNDLSRKKCAFIQIIWNHKHFLGDVRGGRYNHHYVGLSEQTQEGHENQK